MAKKRGNNEGSVYKRSNVTWSAQATLQGRRLSRTFKTQRECQEWLKKIRGQIDDGLTLISAKISFVEYIQNWMTSTKTSKKPRTFKHYSQLIRCYILPNFNEIKIRDLRPDHLQAFYNKLFESQVGVHTIRKIHTLIHSALQQAVKTGMLSRNPASFAQPPRLPDIEMDILNESQISQLLITTRKHRWGALFHLAVVTGMRQSELLGLRWTDLDWTQKILRVERQLVRPDGDGVKFSAPKTRYGKRSITLGKRTIEVLQNHYDLQQSLINKSGKTWKDHGLIFTTNTGTPIHHRHLLRDFKKLLNEAGLPPVRFHDLRHSAASILLNQGVPVIAVSRRLGHARASITLDIYGHLLPSSQNETAELMDNLVIPTAVQLDKMVETKS